MKEEETKGTEAPKQDFEIRKKNKKNTITLVTDSSSHALPPAVKTKFFAEET
jgi:hypothetical protein